MRNHTQTPNQSRNSKIRCGLPKTARLTALFTPALLAITALAIIACSSDPDVIGVRGRSIEIHVKRPVVSEKITFEAPEEQFYVFRPRASNRQMAAVCVTVVNRTSTVMPLEINPEAARLGNRRGDRIQATDPFERSTSWIRRAIARCSAIRATRKT